MAKKSTNAGTKTKTKAKPTAQPKNDTPPNPPETSNVQPTVESPPPPQPQAAPAHQQPLPAADSAPIPIPPPKAPSTSVSIKPDNNTKPPSINYAWPSPPPNTTVQQPVDDGQGTNQGRGQPGENDDMYWGDQQGHADYNDHQHLHPDDNWGDHDDHYDDGDTDDYAESGQYDNTHPHNPPMVPSQSGGVAGGWEQPSSNWDPQPHAPAAPVQSHLIEAGLRGGSTAGGNNTPAGLQSPRPSAGVGSEVGGSGYRSPWTIDGKPPDKIQTASAAARKTVAFAGVKPTPPPSNPGKPPPPAAPPPPPKISQASKQAGLPHGGGADWGYGPPQGGAGAWGAPAPAQTWDPASQPKSHAAPPTPRTTTSPTTYTGAWTQWGKVNGTHFTKITASVPAATSQHPPQPKHAAPPPQPPPPPPPPPPQNVPSAGGRTPMTPFQQQALLAAYHSQQPHGQQRRSQTLSALMVPGMPAIPAGYQWGAQSQHAAAQQHQRTQSGIPNAPPPPPVHNPIPPQQHQQKGNTWPHLPPGQGYGQGYPYDPIYGQPTQQAQHQHQPQPQQQYHQHQHKSPKNSKHGHPKSPLPMQPMDSWGTWPEATGVDSWGSPVESRANDWSTNGGDNKSHAGGGGGKKGGKDGGKKPNDAWGATHDDGWGATNDAGWGGGGGDNWGADAGWGETSNNGRGETKKGGGKQNTGTKVAGWGDGGGSNWGDNASQGGWGASGSKAGAREEGGKDNAWGDYGAKSGASGWGDAGSKSGAGGWGDTGGKSGAGGWGDTGGKTGGGGWGGGGKSGGGGGGWGNDNWDPIAEEDEEDEEGDSYDDDAYEDDDYDEEDGWGGTERSTRSGHHKKTQHSKPSTSQKHYTDHYAQGGKHGVPVVQHSQTSSQWRKDKHKPLPYDPSASRTMNIAAGREVPFLQLAPPHDSAGSLQFCDSHREALRPAQNALYSDKRPALERFRWGLHPGHDPRVVALLNWIKTYSAALAVMGLRKFLLTGKRGIYVTNTEFQFPRPSQPGLADPCFDWLTIEELHVTRDQTLQESLICYNPREQVVIVVFLLSKSGNSMALWRRKVPLTDELKKLYSKEIEDVMKVLDGQPREKAHVDVLPPKTKTREIKNEEKPKKKSWWKRMFG